MSRVAAVAIVAIVLCAGPAAAQVTKSEELRSKFSDRLDAMARQLDGVMGFVVIDLSSKKPFTHLADDVFPTASTIKLAILYELFRQVDEGTLRLDDTRPLDTRHVVGGTGILSELGTPVLSLRDYATLMIVLSDNTATNVLIDAVGMQHVTERMASLGLKETKLRRRMIDIEAARRGDENVSTPREIARLLEVLYKGEGLKKESAEALLAILRKTKSSPIRAATPEAVVVANKPGTLDGVEVDAGIVYLTGRPYILAVMTTYLKDNAAGDAAIRAVSQAAYEYFNRLAQSSEYGRVIR